jgi:hypothetical protein
VRKGREERREREDEQEWGRKHLGLKRPEACTTLGSHKHTHIGQGMIPYQDMDIPGIYRIYPGYTREEKPYPGII